MVIKRVGGRRALSYEGFSDVSYRVLLASTSNYRQVNSQFSGNTMNHAVDPRNPRDRKIIYDRANELNNR